MKVLVLNQPLGNRGDESAHKALIRKMLVTIPNIEITVLFLDQNIHSIKEFSISDTRVRYENIIHKKGFGRFTKPILKNRLFFLWNFHPTSRIILKHIEKCDFVLNAPGGICMGGFQFWDHILLLMMAKYKRKKIIYYGRSFGPFPFLTEDNRKFREISIELLNYFSVISIRDHKTELLADQLHLKYVSTVDTAFLDTPNFFIPKHILDVLGQNDYMIFVPNSLTWHYAFKNKVSDTNIYDFYSRIIDCIVYQYPKLSIVMLPQLFDNNNNDYQYFTEIQRRKKLHQLVVVPDTCNSDVQQSIIKNSRFVVGARYHSIVFAINQGRPFIALSYEHKIAGLLESLGKSEYMIDISESLDVTDSVKEKISHFTELLYHLNSSDDTRDKAKLIANNCYDSFLKFVEHLN